MPDRNSPALSIVIPVQDEVDSIGSVISSVKAALEHYEGGYEIIAVDDGSADNSAQLAAAGGARVISHGLGRGYGAALKTGIKAARGRTIAIIDGDGTYPAEEIPALVGGLESADMVVGARVRAGSYVPIIRRPAKWLLTKLASFLSGVKIPDLNSGLRAFRKDVVLPYLRVLPDRFSFTSTITLLMLGDERSVEYIPIDYRRRAGKSKIVPSDALSFLILIIRTVMFFNPLKFFLPIGLVIFLVGAAKLSTDYLIYDRLSSTSVLLILSAIQIWALGFLAELVLFLERRRK